LRILDQEYHQECYDGGSGIDHQLPRIGIAEKRAGRKPNQDRGAGQNEGQGLAGPSSNAMGKPGEYPVHVLMLPCGAI